MEVEVQMLPASKARQYTKDVFRKKVDSSFANYISSLVQKAAKSGEKSVCVFKSLSRDEIAYIEVYGYSVEKLTNSYMISWF